MISRRQKVIWDAGDGVLIQAVPELEELLDRLSGSQCERNRIIATVDGPGGECVYFGVGGNRSFLSSLDHPYLTTVGDRSAKGSVDYFYQGHHSPIERHHLISMSTARALIREFFITGRLSEEVSWEPV